MDREVLYTHNGILLSHKKKEILPFVTTWMDLEGIMLSEISQRKTNTVSSHLYADSKVKHIKRELSGGYQGLGVGESGRCWPKGTNF